MTAVSLLRVNEGAAILSVAVEPTRLAAGLVGHDASIIVRDRIATPTRDVWRSLERLIRRVVAAKPDEVTVHDTVGVSVCGPVDVPAGAVTPPHIVSWANFPIRDRIEDLTGRRVVVESAGAAAAEAERWVGEAVDQPSYVSVVADAVVDSAGVIDGIRLSGSRGNACSLAHVVVDPGGRTCWCGAVGCLDPYVSAVALEAELGRSIRQATPAVVERAGIMLGRAIASSAAMLDIDRYYVSSIASPKTSTTLPET